MKVETNQRFVSKKTGNNILVKKVFRTGTNRKHDIVVVVDVQRGVGKIETARIMESDSIRRRYREIL
jgi:hypothetical protein